MTFKNSPSVRNRINNICIDGTQIDTVNHTQFLGVIIDNKINWNEHIKYMCKLYKCLHFLENQETSEQNDFDEPILHI